MPDNPSRRSNRILASLSRKDMALLELHLTPVELPLRKQLATRNKRIDQIHFIDAGFASVVANGTERPIEVGLIGREGMTGLGVVMGDDRAALRPSSRPPAPVGASVPPISAAPTKRALACTVR
jgi:hypothetical protein